MSNNPRVTRAKFVPSFGLVVQHADGLIIFVNADGEETPLRAADSKTADYDGLIAKALFGDAAEDGEAVKLLREFVDADGELISVAENHIRVMRARACLARIDGTA